MFCPNCGKNLPEDLQFCVYCGANVAEVKEVTVLPEDEVSAPQHKPKKKRWIAVLAILLAAALAGGTTAFFLMPRSYQVLTNVKQKQTNGTTTTEYTYDGDGRLIEYQSTVKPQYSDHTQKTVITYAYGKGDLPESAVVKMNGEKIAEIEYTYTKGVLKKVKVDAEEDRDVKVDSKGRITRIQGNNYEASYKYHANNKLKERDVNNGDYYRSINRWDEDGNLTEVITYYQGEESSRTVCEYDENGNFSCIKSYANKEKMGEVTLTYTYEKKEIVGATMKMDTPAGGGEIEFAVKKKGDKYEAIVKDIDMDSDADVDEETLEQMEDIVVEFKLDKDGTILGFSISIGDETFMEMERAFEEMKLPRNYEQPDFNNPIWFIGG